MSSSPRSRGEPLRVCSLVLGLLVGLPAFAANQPDAVRELTILHFNDLHARLRPDADGLGGFAHLATVLQRERAASPATLTLHAGDLVQGTPVSTLFEGVPVFEVANHLRLDANCLGNHEFDYGWQKIADFMKVATFPTVSANVLNDADERLIKEPFVLRDVGGIRVAIVGALLERMGPWGPWRSAPLLDTLRPIVTEARKRADLVLVLGHIEREEIQRILRQLPDVAVVVAGHEHAGLDREIAIDGRVGVNAQGYGREVGRLRLRYDTRADRIVSHQWTRIAVDSRRFPADAATKRTVDAWESKVSAVVDVAIGRATRRLNRDEVRRLIQRTLRERFKTDVGYFHAGGVRDFIPQGQLLARHMWNVSPFDDRIVTLDISGGRLLQFMDPKQAPALGLGVQRIVAGRRYRVATVDFIGQGWIDRDRTLRMNDEGVLLRDVLIDWVKQQRVIP